MNIYVSKLNFRTTGESLQALFAQYGEVSSANIITDRETGRSRGFGFVEMPDEGQGQSAIDALVVQFEKQGLQVGVTKGVDCSILGLVGDTTHLDMNKISTNDNVERVMRVSEPYKRANRKFHPEDSVIQAGPAASHHPVHVCDHPGIFRAPVHFIGATYL